MNRKHNSDLTVFAKKLRQNMTVQERKLWFDFLRDYPVRFLRQKVIDNFIADFYCHKARLVVELDGSQHYEPTGLIKDAVRTSIIESRDLLVVRIPNNVINLNFVGVCEYLDSIVRERANIPQSTEVDSPL